MTKVTTAVVSQAIARTLVELVPPVALTTLGSVMVLAGQGLESLGRIMQTRGHEVETFGKEQMMRSTIWFPDAVPTFRQPPPHSCPDCEGSSRTGTVS
jgi:hypothetical protein